METQKIKNSIQNNVADTLFIPLLMKCRETKRKNSFFYDPLSCSMVEKIDYDFDKYGKAIRSSVGVGVRANYFDTIAKKFIEKNTSPVIVNVGCGLDTRFQRIGKTLTDNAIFYELDLPEVIQLRKQLLPETKNNIYLSNSMFETEWLDKLVADHPNRRFLFLIEGVLMYFVNEKVKSVFKNIAARFNHCHLLFDVTSSWMCKNSHRHDTVKITNAQFNLSCDNDKEFETYDSNLKHISTKLYSNFKDFKNAGIFTNVIMRLAPKIKQASRILSYKVEGV